MSLLVRLNSYRPFTAMLVGDFMLDQHLYGAAERLSPDAPVPILQATSSEDRPGGASNVALCLQALKAEVRCFGVLGDDAEGTRLRTSLGSHGCNVTGLITDPARPTTIKRSFIGLAQHRHPQKMFRVDVESRDPLDGEQRTRLLSAIEMAIDDVDVIVIEDYNKGVCCEKVCQRVIELGTSRGKPVLIDPAAIEQYAKYRGATAITPNRSEAELATGLDTPIEASQVHNAGLATKLLHELDLEAVVVTLDKHGALLECRSTEETSKSATADSPVASDPNVQTSKNDGDSGGPMLVPTIARSVYDVSGAGDMVIAALAGGIANGLSWREAVEFANTAAGLEVQVFGVQPIAFNRVLAEIMARDHTLHGKVRTLEALLIELDVHRAAGRRIVFTNGCFDVIHAGHVAYLREAKNIGRNEGSRHLSGTSSFNPSVLPSHDENILVVALNNDAGVRRLKGEGRPIYPERERLEVLSELQCVDYLTVFSEQTVHSLLEAIRPDVFVKGGDYRPEEVAEYDLVQELGLEMRILTQRPGLGSTQTIERMTEAGRGEWIQ